MQHNLHVDVTVLLQVSQVANAELMSQQLPPCRLSRIYDLEPHTFISLHYDGEEDLG